MLEYFLSPAKADLLPPAPTPRPLVTGLASWSTKYWRKEPTGRWMRWLGRFFACTMLLK